MNKMRNKRKEIKNFDRRDCRNFQIWMSFQEKRKKLTTKIKIKIIKMIRNNQTIHKTQIQTCKKHHYDNR